MSNGTVDVGSLGDDGTRSDAELVDAYRGGDVEAVGVLVERHGRALLAYLRGSTRDPQAAEEAFQETWLRVLRHLHGYRNGSFRAWLTTIARNLLIDRSRRRRPEVSLDAQGVGETPSLEEQLADGGARPEEDAAANELAERVRELVARLPAAQREVFLMRTQQQLTFAEIAALVGVPLNTALGRMHYAVRRLRRDLEVDDEA